MFKTLDNDRSTIERKYHNPEKEFDAFKRMAYHGIGYIEESGLDDEQILNGLKQLEKETEKFPHPVARAKAIKYVLENERIYINEHDYFVGLYSLSRLANRTTFDKWAKDSQSLRDTDTLECSRDFNNSGAVMIWTDYDHVVPDWKSLMELGFSGIRERAREYKRKHKENGTLNSEMTAFFEGIEIQYTAIIELIDRMYHTALKQEFEKATKITECLKNLRNGAPSSFYEALQLIYIYFIISESIDSYQVRSLGNGLDNTLYAFYKNDIASNKITKEDACNYLSYFLIQWSAIGNYWGQPFYMGGTNLDGSTRYNELSELILETYDELEIYNPKIQLKINENTPDNILNKAFDMVRRKNASIVFCCEPAMIKAVMGYGATYEEALNMDIRGCYETGVRANEVSTATGYVNPLKAVVLTLHNGFDPLTEKQIGVHTGDVSEFASFEDFYKAFLSQYGHLIEETIRCANAYDPIYCNESGNSTMFNFWKFLNTALAIPTVSASIISVS
jgi:pyruvate-formate lyase